MLGGGRQRLVNFEPDEAIDAVFCGEAGYRFDFMLPYSPREL
jgi:hypothetical protein